MKLDALLNDQRGRRKDLLNHERYVLHDQWDDGRGWVGPLPEEGGDQALDLIKRFFTQRNALKEVTTRHRDAVIGREPAWDLVTDDRRGTVKLRQEAVDALVNWWDESNVLTALQTAALRLLFAQETSRKTEEVRGCVAPLRLFIKSSSVDASGRIPKRTTLSEALADISVHAATPTAAGVLRNLDGDPIATRYEYTADDLTRRVEVTGVGGTLAALDLNVPPTKDTLVVILNNAGVEEVTSLPIGGRLLVHEMTREPLLTPAAISQQKLINKAWTMLSHNLDVAGFTERVFLNAELPGHWENEIGERVGPGEGKFVPEDLRVGAGVSNYVQGIATQDASGGVTMTSPNVLFRDPVPPEAFTNSTDAAYKAVLAEVKQLHVLLSGDAVASGLSRRQATADYVDSLGLTAVQVQAAVRWLLGTALAVASVLMGRTDRYSVLRPTAKARISVVQPTAEDITATIAKKDAGLISRETGMVEVGVEDPDAELERINNETSSGPEVDPVE